MKVLICSNGPWPDGDHRTAWAFDELRATGDVIDYLMLSQGQDSSEERRLFLVMLEKQMKDYRPDLVIWHMDPGQDLSERFVSDIAARSILVYQDLDPWMPIIKPTGRNQAILTKIAKRVFVLGMGCLTRQFPNAGERLRYFPNGYCDMDIPTPAIQPERNLVFIGSIHRRWGRVLGQLGPEQHHHRTRNVRILQRRLGKRFIVHGRGYPAKWHIAPCPFDDQFKLFANNIASFATDTAPGAAGYFSNRTAFALACGSIHIKIKRPGDEFYFRDCPGLIPVKDGHEAADAFEMICSWSDERLRHTSRITREFAIKNLRKPDLYRRLLRESLS